MFICSSIKIWIWYYFEFKLNFYIAKHLSFDKLGNITEGTLNIHNKVINFEKLTKATSFEHLIHYRKW